MRKSAISVFAAALLLAGCEGVTEPPYPRTPDDDTTEPTDPDDGGDGEAFAPVDAAPRHIPLTFPAEPYLA